MQPPLNWPLVPCFSPIYPPDNHSSKLEELSNLKFSRISHWEISTLLTNDSRTDHPLISQNTSHSIQSPALGSHHSFFSLPEDAKLVCTNLSMQCICCTLSLECCAPPSLPIPSLHAFLLPSVYFSPPMSPLQKGLVGPASPQTLLLTIFYFIFLIVLIIHS